MDASKIQEDQVDITRSLADFGYENIVPLYPLIANLVNQPPVVYFS